MKTDQTTLRFNQISIIAITASALLAQMPGVIACLAAIMLLGSLNPRLALFKRIWERNLRDSLGVKPEPVDDDPRAHNFAQLVGGLFLTAAAAAFLLGLGALGFGLALTVIALALLNLSTRICVGCLMYFQYKMLRYRLSHR